MDDLGYAAWKHLNLGLIGVPVAEQGRRVDLLARSYGAQPDTDLLVAIRDAQLRMRSVIEAAPAGQRRDNALAQLNCEQEWLASNESALIS